MLTAHRMETRGEIHDPQDEKILASAWELGMKRLEQKAGRMAAGADQDTIREALAALEQRKLNILLEVDNPFALEQRMETELREIFRDNKEASDDGGPIQEAA